MPEEHDVVLRVIDGRWMWEYPDGTLLRAISGGAPDDPEKDPKKGAPKKTDKDPDDDDPDDDDEDEDEDDEDLDDKAKAAIARAKRFQRKAERQARKSNNRLKTIEKELDELKAGTQTDHEKELEQAKLEARKEAESEILKRANTRIVAAEVRALAGRKLNDPEDAVRLLDLSDFEPDEDGEIDTEAIKEAIDELLNDKPYLAADPGEREKPTGKADGGARRQSKASDDELSPRERMRRAHEARAAKVKPK